MSDSFATLLTERDRDGIVVGFPALEAIVDAFEILSEAQKSFEGANYPTLHLALPSFQSCLDELDRIAGGGHAWRGQARGRVPPSTYSRRFCAVVRDILCQKAKVHDLWLVGCFLHPFLREYQFIPDMDLRASYRTRAESLTRVLYRAALPSDEENDDTDVVTTGNTEIREPNNFGTETTGKRKFSLLHYADTHFQSAYSADEVSRYNAWDITSLNLDKAEFMNDHFSSMKFWYRHKMTYPTLYKVARRVMAITISSCANERVFSALALMTTSNRASMTPDTLDDIMVLRTWSNSA